MSAPRNVLKNLMKTIVLPALCLFSFLALAPQSKAAEIDFDRYAAVAYSPSTGAYGYAWNHYSRGQAESVALANCTGGDAKIVGWVQGGWLVLAVGDNNAYGVGWQYGDGASNTDAGQRALDNLHKYNESCKTMVVLCSGDVSPQVFSRPAYTTTSSN